MAKYFALWAGGPDDGWLLAVEGDSAPLNIWTCSKVDDCKPMRFFVYAEGKRLDFEHTAWASIPVISRRMADCLQSIAPHDIQRIPASVRGEQDGKWEVLNVLARPDCIDYSRSKASFHPKNDPDKPGKPRGFLKLIIDPNHVGGHKVFRPLDWEVELIVAESVKQLLEQNEMTGMEFWPVTE